MASGIDFKGGVVDDVKKDFKAVHYDHGNLVAVADIDSDGALDLNVSTHLVLTEP
ncbi:MAG: hypothetical protein VYE73_17625 [Acidobacteriota bacterium]|nr:hypothetical protein [Acidobacteriota bacterium]